MTTAEFGNLKLRDQVYLIVDNKVQAMRVNKRHDIQEFNGIGNEVSYVKISACEFNPQSNTLEDNFVQPDQIFLTKEDLLKSL